MEQEMSVTYLKKQYRMMRLIACMVAGLFLIAILCAAVLLPKAVSALEQTEQTLVQAEQAVGELEAAVKDLRKLDFGSITTKTDELLDVSIVSIENIGEAMGKVNDMDIDALNEAIRDLQAIVQPLARLVGR